MRIIRSRKKGDVYSEQTASSEYTKIGRECSHLDMLERSKRSKGTVRVRIHPFKLVMVAYLFVLAMLKCLIGRDNHSKKSIEVSVIIVTYKKPQALANLLPSILAQKKSNFEVIIIDNGCLDETKNVIHKAFGKNSSVSHKYLPLCYNPGYTAANNAALKLLSPTSDRLLFLNDDVILSTSDFIKNMVQLADTKEKSSAIGCKLLNGDGRELIEAGSIVWNDASAAGVGRGRKDIHAPEFSYPRPVDYVSGACLLVDRKTFEDYGGFDGEHFPNYYEDTDLQLHIQHDLGREVWFQPKSVAMHDEHASFGTAESEQLLMQAAAQKFAVKWGRALKESHVKNPYLVKGENEQMKTFFLAADLRARNPNVANILYFDDKSPNKSRGSGYGRSFDNLSMIAELGHRVTLVTRLPHDSKNWCDDSCVDDITGLGIEYVTTSEWNELVHSRIGYYDIVIISRPSTFMSTYREWQDFYRLSSFSLIYDCVALWYRRDEILEDIVQEKKIQFPGYDHDAEPDIKDLVRKTHRRNELKLMNMADTVVTVSQREKKFLNMFFPDLENVEVIGHTMDLQRLSGNDFSERNGILFVASFSNSMYYNGDAIWYFLKEIYPLVLKETSSSEPIPLTIAGRDIPDELRKFVQESIEIVQHVTFSESPSSTDHLFERHRIFIAPHLYGAGIQYKVSEALSFGLPVVMSKFTQQSFGRVPGCVGVDNESFSKCIIDLNDNEKEWEALRNEGTSFIQQTHSRQQTMEHWSEIIRNNFEAGATRTKKNLNLLTGRIKYPTKECKEGEELYLNSYNDAADMVREGILSSGFQHWLLHGKFDGRNYYCSVVLQ